MGAQSVISIKLSNVPKYKEQIHHSGRRKDRDGSMESMLAELTSNM